ncbi:MAG: hypothetical protein ABFE07_28500 [Armatimonadia bacterium]
MIELDNAEAREKIAQVRQASHQLPGLGGTVVRDLLDIIERQLTEKTVLTKALDAERAHVWHLERILAKVETLSIRLTPAQMASDTGPLLNEIRDMVAAERQRILCGDGLCGALHKSGTRCTETLHHKGPHRNGGLGWWDVAKTIADIPGARVVPGNHDTITTVRVGEKTYLPDGSGKVVIPAAPSQPACGCSQAQRDDWTQAHYLPAGSDIGDPDGNCPMCGGSLAGVDPANQPEACEVCGGSGFIVHSIHDEDHVLSAARRRSRGGDHEQTATGGPDRPGPGGHRAGRIQRVERSETRHLLVRLPVAGSRAAHL